MQAPLRVGLNLIFLGERAGGAGRYARELPGALLAVEPATELHVFISRDAPADLREEPWAGEVRWTTVPISLAGPPTHVPAEYLILPALAAARRLDVLHSPANTGPAITPSVASVVSVLDLIWLHRPEEWEASARVHRTMRRRVGRAVRNADRIFAISATAAADLTATLGVPAGRIELTPLGARRTEVLPVGEEALRGELDLGAARLALCVAQMRPYKNLHRLIRALAQLDPDVVLVLPGALNSHTGELRDLAERLGVASRVRFPGWLSDERLEGLYAACELFVLPSLIEGFGLPVIDAMLRGAPVACSSTAALAEIAGEAALTFDPESQDQVTGAMRRLLEDRALAERLRERGFRRAAQFTWEQTARSSLAGYRRAIGARKGDLASRLDAPIKDVER